MDVVLMTSSILAEAARVLTTAGYRQVESVSGLLASDNARVFEDSYGIVAVLVYDTWESLGSEWPNAQGALVELMSEKVPSVEPKAWEGYLVLLTPGLARSASSTSPQRIRLDTIRVRKLVATGEDLTSLGEVGDALLPLLDLESNAGLDYSEDVLQLLPSVIGAQGIDEGVTRTLVDCFRRNEPLLEGLHTHLLDK
jgi:hypothetical protein